MGLLVKCLAFTTDSGIRMKCGSEASKASASVGDGEQSHALSSKMYIHALLDPEAQHHTPLLGHYWALLDDDSACGQGSHHGFAQAQSPRRCTRLSYSAIV